MKRTGPTVRLLDITVLDFESLIFNKGIVSWTKMLNKKVNPFTKT